MRRSNRGKKLPKKYQDFDQNLQPKTTLEQCPKCKSSFKNGITHKYNEHIKVCFKTCYQCPWTFKDTSEYKKHEVLCNASKGNFIKEDKKSRTWNCILCPDKAWRFYREAFQHCFALHQTILTKDCKALEDTQKRDSKRTANYAKLIEEESPLRPSKRARLMPRNHQVGKIDDTKILEEKEKADRSQVSDKEVEVISMIKREHVSEIDQDISTLYKCPLCQKKYLSADFTVKHIEKFHKISQETQSVLGLEIQIEKV